MVRVKDESRERREGKNKTEWFPPYLTHLRNLALFCYSIQNYYLPQRDGTPFVLPEDLCYYQRRTSHWLL